MNDYCFLSILLKLEDKHPFYCLLSLDKCTGPPALSLFVVRLAGETSAPLRGLTGSPALHIQLEVVFLPLEQAVRQQLLLDVLKADTLHRVGEALAGQALLPE